jgi:hypothetical protein
MVVGASVREITRDGAEWDAMRSEGNFKEGEVGIGGRRGGVDEMGRLGRVVEGAGFGEGMFRMESRDVCARRGVGFGVRCWRCRFLGPGISLWEGYE